MLNNHSDDSVMLEELERIKQENARLQATLQLQEASQGIYRQLGALLDMPTLLKELPGVIQQTLGCQRVLLFINRNQDSSTLEYGSMEPPLAVQARQEALENTSLIINMVATPPLLSRLQAKQCVQIGRDSLHGTWLEHLKLLPVDHLTLAPLLVSGQLSGLLVIHTQDGSPATAHQRNLLEHLTDDIALIVHNATHHTDIVERLADSLNELNIMQQIDEELNDTMYIERVFNLILDWALRFTQAQAASLALYDAEKDTIKLIDHYGYTPEIASSITQADIQDSITKRVATSGKPEIVPDVAMDKDHFPVANNIRSQMSVPIKREEQVIAVLSLETKRHNGFTDENLNFVVKLSQRAGIAVDNARLFSETNSERRKLAQILRSITDIVIVITPDNHITLMNPAAITALQLHIDTDYTGKRFSDVVHLQALRNLLRQATEIQESLSDEVEWHNGRTYHARVDLHDNVGWIIVLRDITHIKETEALKNELIASISHDLKQPLSVMRGYLDLLQMVNIFDEKSEHYMRQLDNALGNMRQLIDDMLDLAHIDAGIELKYSDVDVVPMIRQIISGLWQAAEAKALTIKTDFTTEKLIVSGDANRLNQIFANLIGNAVKYTPPSGWVQVSAEDHQQYLRITVEDNGLGISPEDKALIFERFYRVRRPETDSIEGTGLGLAIVRSLIEAHDGKIDLFSELGQGSRFRVSLPISKKDIHDD